MTNETFLKVDLKQANQVKPTSNLISRNRKLLAFVTFLVMVILAIVLGVGLSRMNNSDSSPVKKDTASEFETTLVSQTNSGASDLDIKRSNGDHIEAIIHLTNGDVTFILDKVPDA